MRLGTLTALILLASALGVSRARAQRPGIIGSWRGTSTCVDLEYWPACHDEIVIYEVRAKPGTRDSVTLRADKVVNGVRDFMGESDFAPAADSSWVSEFGVGRGRSRIVLRVVGAHMTGTLTDVSSGRRVRDMALDRVP